MTGSDWTSVVSFALPAGTGSPQSDNGQSGNGQSGNGQVAA